MIKYLDITLDARLTFKQHLESADKKAVKTTALLTRLMTNVGGPAQNWRTLRISVSTLITLYDAPIWADTMLEKSFLSAQERCTHGRACLALSIVWDSLRCSLISVNGSTRKKKEMTYKKITRSVQTKIQI